MRAQEEEEEGREREGGGLCPYLAKKGMFLRDCPCTGSFRGVLRVQKTGRQD